MSYAITYRERGFFAALLLFTILAVIFVVLAAETSLPLAMVFFAVLMYLLLRVPLIALARGVEKVKVRKIAEVEVKPKEVFKALVIHSNAYRITLFALSSVILAVSVISPNLVILPLNVLILILVLSVFENTKVTICREGLVNSRLVLVRWSEIVDVEEKGEWIILRRKLNFPLFLPKNCLKYLNFDSLHE